MSGASSFWQILSRVRAACTVASSGCFACSTDANELLVHVELTSGDARDGVGRGGEGGSDCGGEGGGDCGGEGGGEGGGDCGGEGRAAGRAGGPSRLAFEATRTFGTDIAGTGGVGAAATAKMGLTDIAASGNAAALAGGGERGAAASIIAMTDASGELRGAASISGAATDVTSGARAFLATTTTTRTTTAQPRRPRRPRAWSVGSEATPPRLSTSSRRPGWSSASPQASVSERL